MRGTLCDTSGTLISYEKDEILNYISIFLALIKMCIQQVNAANFFQYLDMTSYIYNLQQIMNANNIRINLSICNLLTQNSENN